MKHEFLLVAFAAGIGTLLLAAAILVIRGGGRRDPLRDRIRGVTDADARRPVDEPSVSIRLAEPDQRALVQYITRALGYDRELPPTYAASVPAVSAICGAAGIAVFWRASAGFGIPVGVLAALITAALLARFLFRRKTKIYRKALFNQIPDSISLVLRAVRAGLPVGEALRNLGREVPSPSRDEFTRVAGEMALGIPVDKAIWNLYNRTQLREYAFFAVTLSLQGQTGGNLGETLQNLADMVRRRVSMAAKARALAAEARTSAGILAGLPFFTSAAILVVNPGYVSILFTDKRGPAFLAAFVVLLALGMFTIRTLIQRATQD